MKTLKIFLSHAWHDKLENPSFKLVEESLKEQGFEVWIDVRELNVGDKIRPNLEKSIKSSDFLVVLWSNSAKISKDVNYEIEVAKKNNIRILPCIIDRDVNLENSALEGCLYFDLANTAKGINVGVANLVKHLNDEILNSSEFKDENQAISQLWQELAHIFYRMREGASGNDISNLYLRPAVEKCKKMLSKFPSVETQIQIQFFEGIIPIMNQYPLRFQDTVKKAKLFNLLYAIDPENKVIQMCNWKNLMMNFIDDYTFRISMKIDEIYSKIEVYQLEMLINESYSNRGYRLNNNQIQAIREDLIKIIFKVPEILSHLVLSSKSNNHYENIKFILEKICSYYESDNDLINDNLGLVGLLDDTYLAIRFIDTVNKNIENSNQIRLIAEDLNSEINTLVFILNENIIAQIDQEVQSSLVVNNSNIWNLLSFLSNINTYQNNNYSNKKSMLEIQIEGALGLY